MDVRAIPRDDLGEAEGVVPFTIVHLPATAHETMENPRIDYDEFYLRSGLNHAEAIQEAQEEFESYGFREGRVNPQFYSGRIHFEKDRITIEPRENSLNTFNFWAAEGIIGKRMKHTEPFPKISTERERTKKIYELFGREGRNAGMYDETNLVDMLTDSEEPCSIFVEPEFLRKEDTWQRARNRIACDIAIVNFGRIGNKHRTYFLDLEKDQWYQLMNQDVEAYKREMCARQGMHLPEVGVVTKIESASFREADKVPGERDNLYFDGTMNDVFEFLQANGVNFEEGILDR